MLLRGISYKLTHQLFDDCGSFYVQINFSYYTFAYYEFILKNHVTKYDFQSKITSICIEHFVLISLKMKIQLVDFGSYKYILSWEFNISINQSRG